MKGMIPAGWGWGEPLQRCKRSQNGCKCGTKAGFQPAITCNDMFVVTLGWKIINRVIIRIILP